jgi:hypothetical protein
MDHMNILPYITYLINRWQKVINILHKLSVVDPPEQVLSQKKVLAPLLSRSLDELSNDYKYVITNLFSSEDSLWSVCIRYQWFVCYFTVKRMKEMLDQNLENFYVYGLLPSKEELEEKELGIVCVNDIITKLFHTCAKLRDKMIWGFSSPTPQLNNYYIFKKCIDIDRLLIYAARLESFPVLPDCLHIYSNSTNETDTDTKSKQLNICHQGKDVYNNKDTEVRVCLRCKINLLHLGITDKQEQRTHFHCHCTTFFPTSDVSMKASLITRIILLNGKIPLSHQYNTFLHVEIIRNKFSLIGDFVKSFLKQHG